MLSAKKLTENTIDAIKGYAPTKVTVASDDTTSRIYKYVRSIAEASARIAADAQRLLWALSFLGARHRELDNVCADINVRRLPHETDESLRANAPRLFHPGSRPETVVDPEWEVHENSQLDDIERVTAVELSTLMRSKFFGLVGPIRRPLKGTRLFDAVAYKLRELDDFIFDILKNYRREEADDISDTVWAYLFSALRPPGMRDAALQYSGYNELTVYGLVDVRAGRDARNRRVTYVESEVLAAARATASEYLPEPDRRVLRAPVLKVRCPQLQTVYVDAVVHGNPEGGLAAVLGALEDEFYARELFGSAPTLSGLSDAVLGLPGVTSVLFGSPSPRDLAVGPFEIVRPGYMNVVVV